MRPEDRTRILHMIEQAEIIADFVSRRERSDLNSDPRFSPRLKLASVAAMSIAR